MSPQTYTQDTKAGRRSTQGEKQSEEGQRELKGEDKELSSARDLVVGFRRWGRYDVSLFLARSHKGELRWSGWVEHEREKPREENDGKGDEGTAKKPRFHSSRL